MKLIFTIILSSLLYGATMSQSIFTDITAIQYGDSIMVSWTLLAESTCFDMHVMRADGDAEYETINTVSGVCGGSEDQYYSYLDKNGLVSGTTYQYIISASSGTFTTDPVEIQYINAGSVQIFVYPNPVMTDINITIDNQYKPGFLVELYSLDGSLLNQSIQFENLFTLNTGHLAASTYLLKITTEDGIIFGDKIVVQ